MRKVFFLTVCLAFLLNGPAWADFSATLSLGSSFNSIPLDLNGVPWETAGGGTVWPSTLNGTTLPYVYCLGLTTSVLVPATYDQTYVNTTTGKVYGNQFGPPSALNQVTNAGEVAWLASHYAASATTQDQQVALQAAIWHVIAAGGGYGDLGDVSLDPDSSAYGLYTTYLTALGNNTADTTNFLWMSPGANGTHYQGLITDEGSVVEEGGDSLPVPPAIWLSGSSLTVLIGLRSRLRKWVPLLELLG